MNEEKTETSLKFQSKDEIARCIHVLTPFADTKEPEYKFALEKIKELTKLL